MNFSVTLAPAYNVINSMGVILHMIDNAGVDNWLMRRSLVLPEEVAYRHQLFFSYFGVECLCMALDISLVPDFPTYLRLLHDENPVVLRDRIFKAQHQSARLRTLLDFPQFTVPDNLLADHDTYVAFFMALWQAQSDEKIVLDDIYSYVSQIHIYLHDPPRLQRDLVEHLDTLWYDYFQPEWEAVRPGLESVVRAMSSLALDSMPLYDAMQVVTGRNLRGIFDDDQLATFERIEFIPSKHNGPYISWFGNDHTLWIAYGARLPDTGLVDTDQLLNCLNAIGDTMRLKILMALRERGALSTQDIIDMFDLNKSAASRHLRQLRANELIVEHRELDNKTKYYRLHSDIIATVINNLEWLLGQKEIVN